MEIETQPIKTVCEFLFFDQYEEAATFSRFEKCFQPLFNNIDISFENVFKEICGEKKKYITYSRFSKAYLYYINKKKHFSEDTKTFFDKLFNSILKKKNKNGNFIIGESRRKANSFSSKNIASKSSCITKVLVLTNKNEDICGINLQYDGAVKCEMCPKKIEKNLFISLEMTLNPLDEESEVINYTPSRIKIVNDGITHIFGTFSPENSENFEIRHITFLGFKCISGKTYFVGIPKGDGFLFGEFGNKLHDLKLQTTENGIIKLQPGFIANLRANIYLDSFYKKKLSNENLDEDKLIKDEKYINKLKDNNEIDKFITTSIIEDDHFLNERHKND